MLARRNAQLARSLATMLFLAACFGTAQAAAQESSGETALIEEIRVTGSRAALRNAIARQRDSDKIVGVVDSDALGNFSDLNVSESLRRIAGIMVENDQGEGRYVTVRGMNADLNAMTINGVSTTSPEDRRGIMLDGVPTDLLDSMTVYKTLTPNLDADTIGGAIDLETLSAFSFDERHIRILAETSWNELSRDAANPKLSATYTDRFRTDGGELGLAVILSDQTRHIIAHNNENGGWSDSAPNDDYELRYYDLERERQGIVVNLDYLSDSGASAYLRAFHNEYLDIEYRGKWETRDGLEDNDPVASGNVFSYANSKVDTEARWRPEQRAISSMQLGTEWSLDNGGEVKLELFGSRSKQDDSQKYALIYRSAKVNSPIVYDNSNPRQPVVSFPAEFSDPASFPLKAFEHENALTTDRDLGARFDMSWVIDPATELQYGLKIRQREKRNDFNFCAYEPVGDILLSSADLRSIPPYLNSVHGPAPSSDNVRSYIGRVGPGTAALSDGTTCLDPGPEFEFSGDEEEESVPADWRTDEDIAAAYLMATTVTDNASWVYGLRYEDTRATHVGKSFDGNGFAGLVSLDNDYSFLAPSVNAKFSLSDNQLARFGVFRSLVRPDFQQSRAGAIIDVEDNRIKGGNPGLAPTSAWNLDLSYEHYLDSDTFFAAGLFYKSIEDSIVEVVSEDMPLRGRTWDRAGTYINTGDSDILGMEFSLQKIWDNGLLFVVNYTHADGESELPAEAVAGERVIPYFKQAENTANLVVGYDDGPWDLRLAANYRSDYLDEVGGDELADRYTGTHLQIDFTLRYRISDSLQLRGAALNLNDRPEYYYFGNSSRLSQYDEYGSTYMLGLRYQF